MKKVLILLVLIATSAHAEQGCDLLENDKTLISVKDAHVFCDTESPRVETVKGAAATYKLEIVCLQGEQSNAKSIRTNLYVNDELKMTTVGVAMSMTALTSGGTYHFGENHVSVSCSSLYP